MYKNFPTKKGSFNLPNNKSKSVRYNDSHVMFTPEKKNAHDSSLLNSTHNSYQHLNSRNDVQHNDIIQPHFWSQKKQAMNTLLTFHYRNPSLVLILTYLSIFTLGLTIGFIPYLKVFIEDCQGNKQQVREVIRYFKVQNDTKTPSYSFDGIYSSMKDVTPKTAYATGNNDIKLTCYGSNQRIKILQMYNSGADADEPTINDFNNYCDKNQEEYIAYTTCITSIKRVYQTPDKENSYTQINYKCELKKTKK